MKRELENRLSGNENTIFIIFIISIIIALIVSLLAMKP